MNSYRLTPLYAALLAASLPMPALSQTVLEEVVVTAQKREQNLQDVPVAVSAFNGEMLEQSGVKDMFDMATIAPSLIVSQSQTSTTTVFGVRGIFTSSQNFGLEPSVGLYVDGVYRARQGSMINNMVDVASVEILRGPQGTLFGRNTPAGAVSMNTIQPDFEGSGFLEGTAGDLSLLGLSGAKSFTLIDDVLAMRATGFIMERDGFLDVLNGEDEVVGDRDRWGGRLQALYTPNDDLTIRITGDYSEVDEICCAAGSYKNNLVADSDPTQTGSDARIIAMGGNVIDDNDLYEGEVAISQLPVSSNEDSGISVQLDWHTDSLLFTSITAYRAHDSYDDGDILFSDLEGAIRINDAEQTQFTQEFRISDSTEDLSYVAGLYYYEQTLDNERDTIAGEYLAGIVGLPPNAFVPGDGAHSSNEQDHTSYALFGQMDYNLTDSLVLTAGLRWTYEEKDVSNTYTDDAPPVLNPLLPNWGFYLFPPLTPTPDLEEDFDDDRITGTIKLSWFFNDMTMLYASFGTGYKSGGVNGDRIEPVFDPIFDAETTEAYEIGMKAEFPEQAIRLNVAIHATDTEDLQTTSFQGGGFVLSNAGVAETYGAEIDLFWLPTDSTTLTLAYAYNHGEYADFEGGPCWVGTPWHTNEPDPGLQESGACDRSGGDISSNPENMLVLTGNQDFRLSDNITGFIYAEYIYTGERMTDVNNDPVKYDGSFINLNLRTGLIFENYDATLTLWGRNLTDDESTDTISDTAGQFGRFIAYPKEPLTWGVTLRKAF